ncbi:MAG TPA: Fe-S-containing protein [Candidatus Saccharimonadales bacterium]|nr:Fe-S-containing protein [Candidatus Saccharimonadales bacterium]
MLESFIITLREGLEAALAVGIALAYLARTGRAGLRRYVFAGLVAGVLASAAGAVLFRRLPLNEDAFGGWVMLAAAALVGSTTVYMARSARGLRAGIERRVESAAGSPGSAPGRAPAAVALFLVSFLLVLREGVETVLFLSAVSLNTSALANFLAGLAGLGAATLLGYLFTTTGLRAHLRRFFAVTTGLLGLMVLQLTVAGLHELSEARVLPSSAAEMRLVGPVVHNDALFFVAMIALAAALLLWPARGRQPAADLSEPEERKARRDRRRAAALRRTAAGLSVGLLAAVGSGYVAGRVEDTPPTAAPARLAGSEVVVPLSELADGRVHWYVRPVDGVSVRFLLALDGGQVRAGLDACEICGAAGYRAQDRRVICRNCGSAVLVGSIGTPGGCNPVPLAARRAGDQVRVSLAALAGARAVFASPRDVVATDPVCGMHLTAADVGATVKIGGRTFQVCRMPECRRRLLAHPERYGAR